MLVPEPSNPYDHRAVRVDVSGRTVGYLPRELAEDYQPVLTRLRGKTGCCVGRVTGGGARSHGIYLHLSGPDSLVPVNTVGESLELLDNGRSVAVTKTDKHQDVIAPLTQGALLPAAVFASLVEVPIQRGKYAGQTTLEVRINGERVGELTKLMADRYCPMASRIAGGKTAGCEALIHSADKGFRVTLMMPEV